jgi:hypothetical protein
MPYKNGVWVIDTQKENGNSVLTQAQKAEIRRKNQEAGSTLMQKATAAKSLPTQEKVTKISNEVLPTTTLQKQSARNTLENSGAVREQRNQAQAQRRAQKQAETAAPLLMNGQLQKRSAKNTFDNAGSVTQKSDFNDYAEAGRQLYERQQIKKQKQFRESGQSTEAAETNSVDQIRFDAMTNDERRVYFYRLAKDGQDAANRYMQSLNNQINARIGFREAEEIENMPSGVGKALRYGAQSIFGGMDQASKGIAQFVNGKAYDPSPTAITSQQIGSNLEGAKKYLFQAGTNIGNRLPSIAVSVLSGGLGAPAAVTNVASGLTTALGSGGNAYGEAKRQGYSELQSRTYGTLIGASEAALEKVLGGISELRGGASVADKLLEKVSGIENGLTRWALTGAVNIGSEINEEEVQNFLEPLFRTVIFGEEYKAPSIEELVDTAITTAISTGIMELGHTTEYQPYDENATTLDRAMMDTMAGRQTQENVSQTQDSNLDRVMQQTFEQYKNPAASEQTTGSPLDGSVRSDAAEAGTTNISDSKGKVKGDIEALIDQNNGSLSFQKLLNYGNSLNPEDAAQLSEYLSDIQDGKTQYKYDSAGGIHKVNPEDHIDNRDIDMRMKRGQHSFQYDNPEIHEYMKLAAENLLDEISNSTRGERFATPVEFGDNGGYYHWTGTKRETTDGIAFLKDNFGISWDRLAKAAEDIIRDEGSENYADANRVEMLLDDMLTNGYRSMTNWNEFGSYFIPPNEAYIAAKSNIPGASGHYKRESAIDGLDDIPISRNTERPDAESSVGAAAYGFDPYTNAANQYGTIEPGENPARVVDVPVSMDGETKVSKFARTAAEAKITTDEMVGKIEQLVTDGKLSHEVYSNKQALEDGAQQIVNQYDRGKTIEQIRSEFVRDANAGKAGAKLVARGTTLYADAIAAKDYQAASDILVALTAVETNAGQSVQAARLLKSMTPEGRIFTIQRMISNLEAQVNKNLKKPKELNVPDNLLDAYQNAETESAQKAALDNIYRNVAEQIPATLREGLQQWRYFSMLANPSTHLKNIMGNVSGAIAKIGKDNLKALGEMIVIGNNEGRTTAFLNPLRKADRSLLNAARADYDTAVDLYEDSVGKYSTSTGGVNDYRRYWKINDPQNALARGVDQFLAKAEKLNDLNSKALEAEDMWFSKPMYTVSLASYMKANHLTEITDEARTYAMSEAKKGTYNDLNTVSKWATRFGNNSKIGRFLSGVIYPFKKVPANVMVRTVEYSPLGYVKGLYDIVQMQRGNTDITVAQTIDDFAAATTGTILLGIGAAMAKQGILRATGVGDDEEKEQQKNAFGAKDFSILIGDTYVPIDSLTLTGTGLLTGAQIWESAQNARNGDEPISLNDIMDALSKITDPVFEQSMLSGLDSVISTIQNSRNDEKNGELAAKMGVQILGNYIGQYVPTLVGRIASSVDKNQRSTYIEPDGAWSPVQSAIQGVQRKVPGWREDMAITRGNWGVPVDGNGAGGIANSAFKAVTPVYPSRTKTDPVEEEIARLHSVNSDFSNFYTKPKKLISVDGENVKLTSGQYDKYTEIRGQTDYSIRKTMLNSDVYKSVPDSIKSKAMELSQQYANEIGKEAAGVGYSASDKWITDLAGKSDDEIAKEILGKAIDSVGGLTSGASDDMFSSAKYASLPADVSEKAKTYADQYEEALAKRELGYEIETEWVKEAEKLKSDKERADYFTLKAVSASGTKLADQTALESMRKSLANPTYTGVSKDIMNTANEIAEKYYEAIAEEKYGKEITTQWMNEAKNMTQRERADLFVEKAAESLMSGMDGGKYDKLNSLYDNKKVNEATVVASLPTETVDRWTEYGKSNGVTAGDVLDLLQFKNSDDAKTEMDENGKKIKGKSTQDKVIAFIDSKDLSDKEKDAWFCCIYSEKNSPWKWAR